jgi:hypothetical protein
MPISSAIEAPPTDLHAPANGLLFFAIFGVMALAAVAWSCWYVTRQPNSRTQVPILILMIVGAALATGVEATFDLLGKIHYAQNSEPMAYTAYGQHLPAHLIFGYIPFCGVLPVVLAQKMATGISRKGLVVVALVTGVAGAGIDSLGALTNSWGYYGAAPSNLLGVAPQMAGEPLVASALLMLLVPLLSGPWRLLLVLLPGSVLASTYAFSGWPTYVVLYSSAPAWASWLAGGITLMLCGAIIWFVATLVGRPIGLPATGLSGIDRREEFVTGHSSIS